MIRTCAAQYSPRSQSVNGRGGPGCREEETRAHQSEAILTEVICQPERGSAIEVYRPGNTLGSRPAGGPLLVAALVESVLLRLKDRRVGDAV